ncbi:glycosyltransferase family 2 protein [Streptacidiphilus sp. PB12-B1b]|uniref:glycosyltransferase family 2 protein n=1 Tax=Streptacidiphilus sp. PB12-B1b TaxID=2705012 RepID=UPI0015FE42B1|nr:glycosyltransferase family A protein [Streptacidiphilus sp. PB12-B1b]QMU78270.1 glycosyltransferase family 2 protein [Streptacidiphilus sp. PB12-B1b]
MSERPELSVVLPCRLSGAVGTEMRWALLRLCLVALDAQTAAASAFEVVVVDDSSDVRLADLVDEFARRRLRIRPRVLRGDGPSRGQSAAYNVGVEAARGRYVLLTTDDSLLAPDAVEAHLGGHARRASAAYLCGTERQYAYGILFRDIITGALHPRGDLAVRAFGSLLGFADIRATAEQLGLTDWTITPDDVRYRYAELSRTAALTPGFQDMYNELRSDRADLRWLCVRMGNHSVARSTLLDIGGVEETVPSGNSDQDLGLKLLEAGVGIHFEPAAASVLLEHRRNLRSFADTSGLALLAERWPRPEVTRLHEYFGQGYHRLIADYRRALAGGAGSGQVSPHGTA